MVNHGFLCQTYHEWSFLDIDAFPHLELRIQQNLTGNQHTIVHFQSGLLSLYMPVQRTVSLSFYTSQCHPLFQFLNKEWEGNQNRSCRGDNDRILEQIFIVVRIR